MYQWSDLASVPPRPGIYAWYYAVELSEYDLNKVISDIRRQRDDNSEYAKKTLVAFLEEFVFRSFSEEPYSASLKGALKPTYEGKVVHKPVVSETLLDRIIERPSRLRMLSSVLRHAIPEFASPIYIGMTKNLRARILKHRDLIDELRALQSKTTREAADKQDQTFALRVVQRGMDLDGLRVAVRLFSEEEGQYLDAENVLNRINFPILGRN